MPDYRLKNGTVWTVKDKDIESFMNSEHGKGATLIEDPSAKKEGPADVRDQTWWMVLWSH